MNQQEEVVIFRSVTKDDVDELVLFFKRLTNQAKYFFHPHSFDKATMQQICSSPTDHFFVMVLHNKIIGYSMLRLFGYEIPSLGCCIGHEYEGKGLGTKLVQWTVDKAKELGYTQVILKVYKENVVAFHVYQKIGFQIIDDLSETKEYKMALPLSEKKVNEVLNGRSNVAYIP